MEDDKQTIMIVTDAWYPQVNGVVRTLSQTREELTSLGYNVVMLTPEGFPTIPCPTYPEIRLSLMPASNCLLYTSPSPRDNSGSRMPSSA